MCYTTLVTLYEDAMAYYGANSSDTARLGGDAATQELAALTLAANAILNLDGFVMKE